MKTYTEDYINDHYADMPTSKIAAEIGLSVRTVYKTAYKLGLKKSDAFLNGPDSGRLNGTQGAAHRFKKGDNPFNKGKRFPGKINATTFRKGNQPHNTKYDGAVAVRKDKRTGISYQFVRVDNGKWIHLHRKVWMDNYGEIPEGGVVRFKDGNTLNCVIENLELVDTKTNMLLNTIHRYPEDIKATIRVISKLKKVINKHG
jgi:hypothetical protein